MLMWMNLVTDFDEVADDDVNANLVREYNDFPQPFKHGSAMVINFDPNNHLMNVDPNTSQALEFPEYP